MIRLSFVTVIITLAVLCGLSFAKDAITTSTIIATYTKQDCEVLDAMLERGAAFDEVNAMGNEGKLYVIGVRQRIVVDQVETRGVLIHVKGTSQVLWISNDSLLRACIPVDE
jgi:hypothetical protein